MINLDKINQQFDLNNIDVSRIIKALTENKKTVIIIFMLLSLVAADYLYNQHHAQEMALRAQITQANGKLQVIGAREKSIHDFEGFKSTISKEIESFDLMALISKDANLYHVTIISLNPPTTNDADLFTDTNFEFTAVADDFKGMMLFLRSIEKSDPPLRVNNWSGREEVDGKITSNFNLSNVHFHL